jgi:hypothetical protein
LPDRISLGDYLTAMQRSARQHPSRRELFGTAFAAGAALLAALPVRAQTKATQAEAQYQPAPKGGFSCAVCTLFRPPRACEIVEGDIAPQGWCKFFDLPD